MTSAVSLTSWLVAPQCTNVAARSSSARTRARERLDERLRDRARRPRRSRDRRGIEGGRIGGVCDRVSRRGRNHAEGRLRRVPAPPRTAASRPASRHPRRHRRAARSWRVRRTAAGSCASGRRTPSPADPAGEDRTTSAWGCVASGCAIRRRSPIGRHEREHRIRLRARDRRQSIRACRPDAAARARTNTG